MCTIIPTIVQIYEDRSEDLILYESVSALPGLICQEDLVKNNIITHSYTHWSSKTKTRVIISCESHQMQ